MSARRRSIRRTSAALAVLAVPVLLVCAAAATASPESRAPGDEGAAVALVRHDGQPQEVLAPKTGTDRATRAGVQRLLMSLALFALLVALWQQRTRVLAIGRRIGWRGPRPIRHRGPPLLPIAS